ncbi:branched-chain amino acid ABC transporter ATP-binding protein/permease [Dactylosporangium sp. CA-233914]|uniref:branched-chain amino acid ABC transporter ATP-binding protein/permease n=1 Tax=Dactylosporangium sp. CA-233914 TaxID=3239934 RepID=UPI003D8EA906
MSEPVALSGRVAELLSSTRVRVVAAAVGVPLLVALPWINADPTVIYLSAMVGIFTLAGTGLNLTMGYTGQVSLGHGALVAVGAYASAILMTTYEWPFVPAALAAMAIAMAAGTVIGLPAFRLSSWYIALVTLGLALVARTLVVELEELTGGWAGLVGIPRATIGGLELDDRGVYWVVVAVNVIVLALVASMARSRPGRSMMVVRDSPELARAVGVDAVRVKLAAFAGGGAVAGLAGALFTANNGIVTPDDFTLDFSIFFLIVVIIGGAGRLLGPLIGVLVFYAVPELLTSLDQWRGLIYGIGLLVLMNYAPNGLAGAVDAWRTKHRVRKHAKPGADNTPELRVGAADHRATGPAASLSIEGVSKSFGGIAALSEVSVTVRSGEIHAVVGPNGSGKTTLLNVVSRLLTPDQGAVLLDGENLLRLRGEQLAGRGVARVFQTPKLLPDATVGDNVVLGGYARRTARAAAVLLRTPGGRREERTLRRHADAVMSELGLDTWSAETAGALPHGRQRLLEMSRALVASPRLLILDEPAAGLAPDELAAFEQLVRLVRDGGTTVVLVEHHIELVARVADTVTVLDQGRVLVTGTPAEALADRRVVDAYLGVGA